MVAYRLHGGLLVALGALQTLAIPTIKSEDVQLHERRYTQGGTQPRHPFAPAYI